MRIGVVAVIVALALAVVVVAVARVPGADALDVMVMAFLRQADLGLEAEDVVAVLAQLAVHQVLADQDLLDPLGEGIEHQRVVVEIRRLDELDPGVFGGDQVGMRINALDQNAGEQEYGNTMMRRKPSLTACSSAGLTNGKVTPE